VWGLWVLAGEKVWDFGLGCWEALDEVDYWWVLVIDETMLGMMGPSI
jgi:hypothetical protein